MIPDKENKNLLVRVHEGSRPVVNRVFNVVLLHSFPVQIQIIATMYDLYLKNLIAHLQHRDLNEKEIGNRL